MPPKTGHSSTITKGCQTSATCDKSFHQHVKLTHSCRWYWAFTRRCTGSRSTEGTTQPVGSTGKSQSPRIQATRHPCSCGYLRPSSLGSAKTLSQFGSVCTVCLHLSPRATSEMAKAPRNPHPNRNPRKRHRAHWIEVADQKYLGPALVESKAELKHIVSDWHGSPTIGRWPMPYN